MSFHPKIQEIAERIAATEKKRKRLAEFVTEVAGHQLKQSIDPSPLKQVRIAAVDGGMLKRSFHGMDCLLVRAAGVCFEYTNGNVASVQYHPSRNPIPRPEIFESLSELDWNHFSSLNRLQEEISQATVCMEHWQPDLLLIDGMLLPHTLDRPAKTSPLFPVYSSLLRSYQKLFAIAKEKKIALAGVVEDSRSTLFCDYVRESILSKVTHEMVSELSSLLGKTRDSNLLHLILEKGERTKTFHVAGLPDLPLLRTFFLKTAAFDRPLKVDYLPETTNPEELGPLLLAISGHHSGYGLPTPLIEADNVAKLSELEMENLYATILSFTGQLPSMMALRRDQRPFT